ncbi:hypothetical protein N7490_000364 [Penicillium lividum]|nr:hypothetical protein N7490_000364 [Penicillium lividum]
MVDTQGCYGSIDSNRSHGYLVMLWYKLNENTDAIARIFVFDPRPLDEEMRKLRRIISLKVTAVLHYAIPHRFASAIAVWLRGQCVARGANFLLRNFQTGVKINMVRRRGPK